MSCAEHVRLERELSQARNRHEAARQALAARIGVTPHEQFVDLARRVDETWIALQRAQKAFDQHMQDHCCAKANGADA